MCNIGKKEKTNLAPNVLQLIKGERERERERATYILCANLNLRI
jgi:hypothetical protein